MSDQTRFARRFSHKDKLYVETVGGERAQFVGPFDKQHAFVQRLGKTQLARVFGPVDAVEIDMGEEKVGRLIGLDKGESGAWHILSRPIRPQTRPDQRPGKSRFSCAEIAPQRDEVARAHKVAKRCAQSRRGGLVRERDRAGRVFREIGVGFCGHCPHGDKVPADCQFGRP